jgi:hypothetical protein
MEMDLSLNDDEKSLHKDIRIQQFLAQYELMTAKILPHWGAIHELSSNSI